MEDVYTIKVKTKPDTRNLYPSERRYSASTVSGLAWVHIALAATSFLLACLALVNPNSDIKRLTLNDTEQTTISKQELVFNSTDYTDEYNATDFENVEEHNATISKSCDKNYILVLAPGLLTVFALAAGIASIMASVRWYVDKNIAWLFIMSIFSTVISIVSFGMVVVWFVFISEGDFGEFYKDRDPFKDFLIVRHTDVVDRNESHLIIKNSVTEETDTSHIFGKRVLSINILIAAFLELLWSLLSVKISYKGMRSNYKDDGNYRRGNQVSVVTTIKGNNTKKMPRNAKLIPPKPDLIEHYPGTKRIFLSQNDDGFYLKNQSNKTKQNTDTSSEFYKERMINFLNRCASLEAVSNIENTSVHSDNAVPETVKIENERQEPVIEGKERLTPVSWGDTPEHTIYNQNTLNLASIFNFVNKTEGNKEEEISDKEKREDVV